MLSDEEKLFLGLDFSTQQLKCVVINAKKEIQCEAHVQFDNDLPEFRTNKGVVRGEKKCVTSPVLMWVKALDMILEKLRLCGADFSKICALSGSAQQHGTVYWACGAEQVLKSLAEEHFLHSQLASCFSITNTPVWMDASTSKQCRDLEKAVGGADELSKITGSKAYERYSAGQIAKIWQSKSTAYKNTERISLVSSFACSLFLGKYAPIDYADGSGMNLFNIKTKSWSQDCIQATAPDLVEKLGSPVPSHSKLGKISSYFVERFGFNEDCEIISFTGDNPSSLVGMGLQQGDLAVSLGTSDTIFMWLAEPKHLPHGHVFINPLTPNEYMGLLCYKNGSASRERVKNSTAGGNWEEFSRLLESTPRGNFGYMGFFYDFQEIMIPLQGDFRFDKADNLIEKFPSSEVEVRALVEGQFIAMRSHLDDLQVTVGEETKLIATGGGSRNKHILQVLADVFSSPVFTMEYANSAALGAAYRALYSINNLVTEEGNHKNVEISPVSTLLCKPFSDSREIYDPMVARFKTNINNLLERFKTVKELTSQS